MQLGRFCPASARSGTDHILCKFDKAMNREELFAHMREVHDVECVQARIKEEKRGKGGDE
jgi:hypothetical protein